MFAITDLIPLLKSLHANPTSHPVFADWFEERGDLSTAVRLRSSQVYEWTTAINPRFHPGERVISYIAHPTTTAYDARGRVVQVSPNPIIREALEAEAMGRLTITPADRDHTDVLIRKATDSLRGTRSSQWFRFDPRQAKNGVLRLGGRGAVEEIEVVDPELWDEWCGRAEDVRLETITLFGWEGANPKHTLCGGWLMFTACLLVGRGVLTTRPLVSRLTVDSLTPTSISTLPL